MIRSHWPGHTLFAEGAAYKYIPPSPVPGDKGRWQYDFKGEGHGRCECGWASDLLPSDKKRRAAHRDHKIEELAKLDAETWTPIKIQTVMRVLGLDATIFWDKIGGIRVTMSFRDLCSFAERICGSISEADLDGLAADEMIRMFRAVEVSGRKQTD